MPDTQRKTGRLRAELRYGSTQGTPNLPAQCREKTTAFSIQRYPNGKGVPPNGATHSKRSNFRVVEAVANAARDIAAKLVPMLRHTGSLHLRVQFPPAESRALRFSFFLSSTFPHGRGSIFRVGFLFLRSFLGFFWVLFRRQPRLRRYLLAQSKQNAHAIAAITATKAAACVTFSGRPKT